MFKKMLNTRSLCYAAVIAALYTALTLLLAPISYGNLQCRVSEALTILPVILPEAIPGLTVGCLLSNLLGPSAGLTDIIFGTLATLLAAVGTYFLRKKCLTLRLPWMKEKSSLPLLSALCPVVSNGIIVGLLLSLSFNLPFLITALEVAVGEAAALLIGLILLPAMKRLYAQLNK